jgi:apolipoprotein N-acyltransferase
METIMSGSQTEIHKYNSAYLLAPGGEIVDWYDKIYLIPFAETPPFEIPIDTRGIFSGYEGAPSLFTRGQRSTIFSLPTSQFGVLICYEAIFPSLARRLVNNGAEFLVNISNDTWLNDDPGAITQHFAFSAFRAVENKRFLVRPATAGLSGFVDPVGRPSHLSTEKDQVVWGKILPHHERTVYTRYGEWFAWGCMGFILIALGVPFSARRQSSAGGETQ